MEAGYVQGDVCEHLEPSGTDAKQTCATGAAIAPVDKSKLLATCELPTNRLEKERLQADSSGSRGAYLRPQ